MDKPDKYTMYDLRDCCEFIQNKYPGLKDVDFWNYVARSWDDLGQESVIMLCAMDELTYIEYEDFEINTLVEVNNKEDFNLLRDFYTRMVEDFGDGSYMRVSW